MGNEMYEVELIANPVVKRMMSGNSLRINFLKWRKTNGPKDVPKAEVKKNVEPVESETPFAAIGDEAGEIDGLRADFETKFGKPAKKTWGVKRLQEEISKPVEA